MKLKYFPWLIGLLLVVVIVLASFPAPVVVQADPAEKQGRVTFNAPFTLHFSHIMNRRSVEESFQILPETNGDFSWKDFRTLEFVPKEPLKIGDEYRIVIKSEAKNIWMKKMGYDTTLDYLVTGPPFVLFTDPDRGGVISKDKVITVMFDRPMDWEAMDRNDLIRIDPSVSGTIEFPGRSAFQFIPKALSPSQSYTVVIPAGLSAADGGKTEETYSWTIATPDLKVEKSEPESSAKEVPLNQIIRIEFDGPAPLEGIKPGVNALLFPSNDLDANSVKKMDGFFNTEVTYAIDETGGIIKNILLFAPTFDYQPGEHYRFVLKSDKDLHLEEDLELEFDTVDLTKENEASRESEGVPAEADSQDGSIQFFVRGENPRLKLNTALSEPATLTVCQVSSNEFIRQSAQHGWDSFKCDTDPTTINPVQKDSAQVINLADYSKTDWVTGIYFASLTQGDKKTVYHFLIGDSSLLMKRSASDLLIWALDLKTGNPLAGMTLEILSYDGEEVGRGTTDENGLFVTDQPFDEGIYVRGKLEEEELSRWALVSDRWLTEDVDSMALSQENSLFVTLNQRVFSPGESLQFHGIWRTLKNHSLSLPEATQVNINVEDLNQNFVSSIRTPMRRNGSFDGSLPLPEDLPSGYYRVTVSDLNHLRLSSPIPIRVAQDDDNLHLEWLEADSHYAASSTPVFIAKARYNSGLPAPKTKGRYELFRRPMASAYQDGAIRYHFANAVRGCASDCLERSLVTSQDFVFDHNGEVKLLLTEGENEFLKGGYIYDLQLSLQASDRESASLLHSFKVHPGSFDLGLGLKHAVIDSSNKAIEASVLAFDHEGKFSEGRKIKLSLIDQGGRGKTVYETGLSSGSSPTAVSIPVELGMANGIYLLRAQSVDEKQNTLLSELPIFLAADSSKEISSDFLLAADQSQYFVGGRAQFLINAPGASEEHPFLALMTYERDGLLAREFLELTQPVSQIFIPVTETMAPGFMATASRFGKGLPPSFSSSSQKIDVGHDDSQILIDLSFDPVHPKPGEKLTLKITSSDYQNQPLASVLSLNVLNSSDEPESLSYARFFSASPSPLRSASNFSPAGRNDLSPFDSFSSMPLSSPLNPAHSIFFDPLISTNITGEAEITLQLPEYGENFQFRVLATKNAYQFGSAVFNLQMNSQLLILPILPSFVLTGDQTVFGASVKNISDHVIQSRLELLSDSVAVKGDKNRNFSLQPGQQTELFFNVVVNSDLSSDELSVTFKSGQDSVVTLLPLPHLKSFTSLPNTGLLEDVWSGRLQLPKEAYSKLGNLVLTMSGGPLGSAQVQADSLENFWPASNYVLAARLLSTLSLLPAQPSVEAIAPLQNMVDALQKTADEDGNYRFWNEPSFSPTLNALVLLAYQRGLVRGLHVDSLQISRTINSLWESFDSANLPPNESAFVLWVLGENAQYDTEQTLTLLEDRENLDVTGEAFLLLNLNQLVEAGQTSMVPLYNSIKAEIADQAIQVGNLVYFENGAKSTAIVLFALSELDSDNPLLEPMANHVVLQENDLIREFSPEVALWTVLSLKSYVDHSVHPTANYIAQAKLNGELVLDQSVTSGSVNEVFQVSVPVGGPLLGADTINDLFIKKNGTGPLYFDAHLMSLLDPSQLPGAEEGMLITRKFYEVDEGGKRLPALSFRKGGNYLSELLIIVPEDYKNVTVSETFPAGTQLASDLRKDPLPFVLSGTRPGQVDYFASGLPAGVYKIETPLQALVTGTYQLLPATIQPMFEPEVVARTEGGTIQIID